MPLKIKTPLDFRPSTEAELVQCLGDPVWRLCSGALYHILTKDQGVIPFKPNEGQLELMGSLWHRNVILKARQRGFTTAIALMWLDHALFVPDQRCGIVAHDRESAEVIFRDKVILAYERMPTSIQALRPRLKQTTTEVLFRHAGGSSSGVRVATSMRSGTIHRLHVSEFGKICARYPDKAAEVVNGSLPAVPDTGIAVIESTAEGKDGPFYQMAELAKANHEKGQRLAPMQYRFHFSAWWQDAGYRLTDYVPISEKDAEYFERVEGVIGRTLDLAQRRWWVATRDNVFSGEDENMWQEYPSFPDEAFQVSTEGVYYARQLTAARKGGRIGSYAYVPGYPVDTYWDIGASDGTAVWCCQEINGIYRFFRFLEDWSEPYETTTLKLQALGCMWRHHYLPHDAKHKRQRGRRIACPEDDLKALGLGGKWVTEKAAIDRKINGINQTRKAFGLACFDEVGCKEGLVHLQSYRKTWNEATGDWSDEPRHDVHSEGADALRQWGQRLARLDRPATTDYDIPLSVPGFRG